LLPLIALNAMLLIGGLWDMYAIKADDLISKAMKTKINRLIFFCTSKTLDDDLEVDG